ncbi:MAG: hypothetical protein QOF42_2974 [Gammaproteobacteria bacterium]|jgi:hypothetical protein|nr:hypothetical protein [Gammaproteobacteria bacterium]
MKRNELLLIALMAISATAVAGPREVQIKFANRGGIWDWDVVDSKTILIQDRARRWYKATLLVNCVDLPFEQKIGFESNVDGSFDKFSTIQTRQMRCPLSSLVRTDAPVKKKSKKADAVKGTVTVPGTVPVPAPAATEDVKPLN